MCKLSPCLTGKLSEHPRHKPISEPVTGKLSGGEYRGSPWPGSPDPSLCGGHGLPSELHSRALGTVSHSETVKQKCVHREPQRPLLALLPARSAGRRVRFCTEEYISVSPEGGTSQGVPVTAHCVG